MTEAQLVILPEEVNDPRVEDQLLGQLSFGMASAPRVADAKTGLLQRPWFAFMLAGLLGGLAAWGISAPLGVDGTRFTGAVVEVNTNFSSPVAARMKVGDQTVYVFERTRITGPGGVMTVADLADKDVKVRGDWTRDEKATLIAYEIQIRGPAGPPATIDVGNLHLRHSLVAFLLFPLVAALVGLFVGAADGMLSRAFSRGLTCGLVGLAIGLGAGFIASLAGQLFYTFGQHIVHAHRGENGEDTAVSFILQMISRGIAWAFIGAAMGLGQGVALRSKKLALNGLIGGMVGALLGGLLFDPIDHLLHHGSFGSDAEVSRAVGFAVIGATTGLMIGVVELLAREAWVKLLTGPLAGKEFVIYKNPTHVGSSPKSDIYLFKDPEVEPTHAALRPSGEGYELEDLETPAGTFVNGRRISRHRLTSGDQIRIGKTVFTFSEKEA